MKYEVEIQFSFNHLIKHASHIWMGLFLLEKENIISLNWRMMPFREKSNGAVKIIVYDFELKKELSIAFDMHDMSSVFDDHMLKNSDVYFKRSYFKNDVALLPLDLQGKVKPYGMNLPTTSSSLSAKIFANAIKNFAINFPKAPRMAVHLVKQMKNPYHQFIGLPSLDDYLHSPYDEFNETVFFQTRLWEQEYVGKDNAQEINSMRVDLIRSLRKTFKDRYIGGLLPTTYAKKYYPDCITEKATDSKGYIKLLKSNLVGIYTRGLNHSIALKLPEYISASLCVVTDNIRNQVSGEFTEGINYLEFNDIDTCLSHCDKLISDKELALYMRRKNHRYYLDNIEPANKLLLCLEEAFSN